MAKSSNNSVRNNLSAWERKTYDLGWRDAETQMIQTLHNHSASIQNNIHNEIIIECSCGSLDEYNNHLLVLAKSK